MLTTQMMAAAIENEKTNKPSAGKAELCCID
jgi:hypothetical protein